MKEKMKILSRFVRSTKEIFYICSFIFFSSNDVYGLDPTNQHRLVTNVNTIKNNGKWALGRILVMPRAGLPEVAFKKIISEHKGQASRIGQGEVFLVKIPENTEERVVANLSRNPNIKFAELDLRIALDPTFIPNDPNYASAWHLTKIEAPLAWDVSQGIGITIAILDSGVDPNHPDLVSKLVPGWNYYDNNNITSDVYGHGTKVAGVAAAAINNELGVVGVSGSSMIMPIRVTDTSGYGYYSLLAAGLYFAADNGARVANMSFRGLTSSTTIATAAQYMKNKNGLVVTGSGNTGLLEPYTPTTTMISVAATDSNDLRTSWSSYGNYVDIAAPGAGIWTTARGGTYGAFSGTSFSSPLAAGVIALMMSANTALKSADLENILFSTAKDLGVAGWDTYYGYGRVNARVAVATAKNTVSQVDNTAPSVSITNPISGSVVSGIIPVDVQTTDNVGVIKVELWVNNKLLSTDTNAPFAFSWDTAGTVNGTANLVVRAFDAAGNIGSSSGVAVSVNNTIIVVPNDTTPPTVKIVTPTAGNVSGNVNISVNASDNNGSSGISLTIMVDNSVKATGTGSSLSASWNTKAGNVSAGSHTIKVIAKDQAGNTSSSSIIVYVVK